MKFKSVLKVSSRLNTNVTLFPPRNPACAHGTAEDAEEEQNLRVGMDWDLPQSLFPPASQAGALQPQRTIPVKVPGS